MQNKTQKIIVLIVFICSTHLIMALKKNDVVKISLPNKTAIEILGTDINKYRIDTAFISENIRHFLKLSKSSNIEEMMAAKSRQFSLIKMNGSILMDSVVLENYPDSYQPVGAYQLSISERDIPDQIITSRSFNKSFYYLQKHQLEFKNKYYTCRIKFDELSQLIDLNRKEILEAIDSLMTESYNEKSLYIEKLHYTLNNDLSYKKIYENDKYPNDKIILSARSGVENVKNSWAASFEASMAFSFGRKGITKNEYGLSYEWQYDFTDPDKRNINQFMNLAYRHDFSKDPENSNAYTFKLGYLMNKQGNLYNNDTFKLGISRPLGKDIFIEPQIYFNSFFKDVIPSIKIGIGF